MAGNTNGVPAPPGADCDAAITPVVTGTVDPGVLDQLAGILLTSPGTGSPRTGPATGMTTSAVRQLAIGHAARLLSGPGGLASWLRTSQLDGYAASVSLPLDIGATTDTIPVNLRRAIARRDQRCRFPGCDQRPRCRSAARSAVRAGFGLIGRTAPHSAWPPYQP
jgi:hypothetical protein